MDAVVVLGVAGVIRAVDAGAPEQALGADTRFLAFPIQQEVLDIAEEAVLLVEAVEAVDPTRGAAVGVDIVVEEDGAGREASVIVEEGVGVAAQAEDGGLDAGGAAGLAGLAHPQDVVVEADPAQAAGVQRHEDARGQAAQAGVLRVARAGQTGEVAFPAQGQAVLEVARNAGARAR